MMRFLSALFIIISFFIAQHKFALIVTLMSISWGAVAGSFLAPYVYGLFWKRTTRAGAAAGMVTGLCLAIYLSLHWGPAMTPVAASVAMLVPFAVVPAVSLITKPVSREVIDRAFSISE